MNERHVIWNEHTCQYEYHPPYETYRGQERVAAMTRKLGSSSPEAWNTGALAEVAGRHAVLVELTSRVCFVPRRVYAPLGTASVPLVVGSPRRRRRQSSSVVVSHQSSSSLSA